MSDAPALQLHPGERLLLVAAVRRELQPFQVRADDATPWTAQPLAEQADVVLSGVGRANAAAAVAWNLARQQYHYVLNVGVCGALPGTGARVGELIAADTCVFCEEGFESPEGFQDMARLGFALGPFEGNRVPCSPALSSAGRVVADHCGAIATVATCSGTDTAADRVRTRTGALAEAMEGAAVVATALRLGIAAGELRAVSNTTGNRDAQRWDLDAAVDSLAAALRRLLGLPG